MGRSRNSGTGFKSRSRARSGLRSGFRFGAYEPERCWVGETHKICYGSREEAEMAARVAEYDHGLTGLTVYKCEYGEHWHLASGG